ncbi:hypothetical protein KCU65_g6919, partial [Aureobasidium melanogenum]
MDSPIDSTISQIGENQWLIGRNWICELREPSALYKDQVYHWQDSAGRTFQVRSASSILTAAPIPIQPIYSAGTTAAVWEFAGLIWKVKSWTIGVEEEAETIRFVNTKFPSVPVPDVICHWTDDTHSVMGMKRASGKTLDDAWGRLSDLERKTIASDLAEYVVSMSEARRDCLETVSSFGVTDAFIRPDSWRSPTFRLEIAKATEYFRPLEVDGDLVFTHGDLNPRNLVIDKGKISCILDWEFAGFFPRWWINYKARIPAMSLSKFEPANAWIDAMRRELEIRGITLDFDQWEEWTRRKG